MNPMVSVELDPSTSKTGMLNHYTTETRQVREVYMMSPCRTFFQNVLQTQKCEPYQLEYYYYINIIYFILFFHQQQVLYRKNGLQQLKIL